MYPHWELCIADDASSAPHVRKIVEEYAAKDSRIKVVFRERNGGISAASNSALELATGRYIVTLDHDDELAEQALYKVARTIIADPSLDMIYSDEDKLTPDGVRTDPFFKPDWSPEYFLACMYTCHLSAYRTELVREVGGWRSEFDTAQDYDLALRIVANGARIAHIPDVLYHWRTLATSTATGNERAKPQAADAARRALGNYLQLIRRRGRVEPGPHPLLHRVRFEIVGKPRVSIIIPSACKPIDVEGRSAWLALECVSSIRRISTYDNIEIVVAHDGHMPPDLAQHLQKHGARPLEYDFPFNWSKVNNFAVNQLTSAGPNSALIFLNDDITVSSPDWIESMLEYALWPEIGAVGARLLFPDGRQQHTGMTILQGVPGHPYYGYLGEHSGYHFSTKVHRNCSAVTGACLMTRRDVFQTLGGFSEEFPINYNDVDYCLRVLESGRRVVYMPYAALYHHESASKSGTYLEELDAFKKKWGERLPRDPYYNPNFAEEVWEYQVSCGTSAARASAAP
jgi:GT2 family glycosyltransferase